MQGEVNSEKGNDSKKGGNEDGVRQVSVRQNVEVKGNKHEPIRERWKTSGIDQVSK